MADQTIVGGRALDAALKTLPAKIERNILRSALRAGGNVFKKDMQANVPVEEGELRASVRTTTRSKKGMVYAAVKVGGKRAPHAHLVEFGTKPHQIKAKKGGGLTVGGGVVFSVDHPGAKPHPFARPSFDAKPPAAIQAVGQKIRERLTKEGLNVPAPEAE